MEMVFLMINFFLNTVVNDVTQLKLSGMVQPCYLSRSKLKEKEHVFMMQVTTLDVIYIDDSDHLPARLSRSWIHDYYLLSDPPDRERERE